MIKRTIEDKVFNYFHKGKIILLLGLRQVGKTTLCRSIVEKSEGPAIWLNCGDPDVCEILSNTTSTRLKGIIW
jgi:uncharacterized protein